MQHILQTDRLTLRKFTVDDAPFILELLNTPGWLQFIGERNVKTRHDAKNYIINGPLQSYADHGYGLSMVEITDGQVPIGMCGVINRKSFARPDIGYAFLPDYQNQGYGFEIAAKTIEHLANTENVKDIVGIVNPQNAVSIRLLEKLGMQFAGTMTLPDDPTPLSLYTLPATG